jgi:hypothetical protein
MGGNPRPAFLPIRSEHFPDADGVLAFLCRQPGGLLAVVKFAQLLFRRRLCFPVSGKCQHPAFASHFEGETVKRESFGRAVNSRCKVTKFDFNREDRSLSGLRVVSCANSVQTAAEPLISFGFMAPEVGLGSIITQMFEFTSNNYNDFRHLSSSFCHVSNGVLHYNFLTVLLTVLAVPKKQISSDTDITHSVKTEKLPQHSICNLRRGSESAIYPRVCTSNMPDFIGYSSRIGLIQSYLF